jgi:hypothetical protein
MARRLGVAEQPNIRTFERSYSTKSIKVNTLNRFAPVREYCVSCGVREQAVLEMAISYNFLQLGYTPGMLFSKYIDLLTVRLFVGVIFACRSHEIL